MDSKLTDAAALRGAYSGPAALEARRTVFRFQRPIIDLVGAVVEAFRSAPDGVVLDVGCGSGANAVGLRRAGREVIAIDMSPGMVAATGGPGAVADAVRLPFADDAAAGALAAHMLYHVPDPGAALDELSRVSRPGGRIVVTGNGADDKRELHDLWLSSSAAVTGVPHPLFGEAIRTDEMTALARRHLAKARCTDLTTMTEVPEAPAMAAYLESTRATSTMADDAFDAVHAEAMSRIERAIRDDGAFRFRSTVGVITAEPR